MHHFCYCIAMVLAALLLPITAIAPYIFYGKGLGVLVWIWEVGYQPFFWHLGFSILAAIVSGAFLLCLQPLGHLIYSISALLITIGSGLFAMSENEHVLLIFIFFLAIVLVGAAEWIRKTLALPYYCATHYWWQEPPKAIPEITARVYKKKGSPKGQDVHLVHFGKQGCFVFPHGAWDFVPAHIELSFRNKEKLSSSVKVVLWDKARSGVGLKFTNSLRGDWGKELEEYLDVLRRAGYVSR